MKYHEINLHPKTEKKELFRVCHFPQIPCKPFIVYVKTPEQGIDIMNTLAIYDLFQLQANIKPDFCNGQDFQVFDKEENDWITWYHSDLGCDINEYEKLIEEDSE